MELVMRFSKAGWGLKTIQVARWQPSGIQAQAWSREMGTSESAPGKGGRCVRVGLKPDGKLLQYALGQ